MWQSASCQFRVERRLCYYLHWPAAAFPPHMHGWGILQIDDFPYVLVAFTKFSTRAREKNDLLASMFWSFRRHDTHPPWIIQLKAGRRLRVVGLPAEEPGESPVPIHHYNCLISSIRRYLVHP